jgi:streptomycin 6-kinase
MSFEKNITSVYKERGLAWLSDLPRQIEHLQTEWNLRDLKPMEHLTYNYVLSGYWENTPIILKLTPDLLSLQREADALSAFAGHGAVALLKRKETALLLQKAIPGRPLKNQPHAIQIALSCLETLHKAPIPKEHAFPHIKDWLADLDKEWKETKKYLKLARRLRDHLLQDDSPEVLLHGDLHQDNILSHGEDWLVIDPKGVIGLSIYEASACVEHPEHDLPCIAERLGNPLETVTQWYFVHLVLAACWQEEDHLDPSRFLTLAESIFRCSKFLKAI